MRPFTIYSILVGTWFRPSTTDCLDSARLRPGNMLQQFKRSRPWGSDGFDR
jgi:hypothetical protein